MRHRTVGGPLLLAALLVVLLLVPGIAAQAPPVDERARDTTLTEGRGGTPTGEIAADIWVKVIWVSAAVFLLVSVLLVYALVRWRHRRGEKREVPQIHGNSKLEIAWTIGPALIMVWLLVISYNGLFAIDDPDADTELAIDVVAHQFFWEYKYPDGTSSSGADAVLRLQQGMWVQLNVTGADVYHAFKIPGLDVMIDAIPGRVNEITMYTGDEPGVYLAQCLRFCGAGHGDMLATVEIFAQGDQDVPYGAAPREPAQEPADPSEGQGDQNETDDQNAPADENETADEVEVSREIEVSLFDYGFDPQPIEIEEGETVRLVVTNDGPAPHDLNLGTYSFEERQGEAFCADEADEETCWQTNQFMPPGEGDSFVLRAPDEPLAFSLWCSVPGHVQQGMISYLSVGGAVPEDQAPQPKLPGPALALLLVAVGAILAVVRHRRRH